MGAHPQNSMVTKGLASGGILCKHTRPLVRPGALTSVPAPLAPTAPAHATQALRHFGHCVRCWLCHAARAAAGCRAWRVCCPASVPVSALTAACAPLQASSSHPAAASPGGSDLPSAGRCGGRPVTAAASLRLLSPLRGAALQRCPEAQRRRCPQCAATAAAALQVAAALAQPALPPQLLLLGSQVYQPARPLLPPQLLLLLLLGGRVYQTTGPLLPPQLLHLLRLLLLLPPELLQHPPSPRPPLMSLAPQAAGPPPLGRPLGRPLAAPAS